MGSCQHQHHAMLTLSPHSTGITTLNTLGEQRESLLRTRDHAVTVTAEAERGRSLLTSIRRRTCMNRVFLWAAIALLVIAIIVTAYFKFIHKSGSSNSNSNSSK